LSNNLGIANIALSPAVSIGMVYTSAGHSFGLLMENSTLNKSLAQIAANAGVDQCCALMISIGAAGAVKPAKGE